MGYYFLDIQYNDEIDRIHFLKEGESLTRSFAHTRNFMYSTYLKRCVQCTYILINNIKITNILSQANLYSFSFTSKLYIQLFKEFILILFINIQRKFGLYPFLRCLWIPYSWLAEPYLSDSSYFRTPHIHSKQSKGGGYG